MHIRRKGCLLDQTEKSAFQAVPYKHVDIVDTAARLSACKTRSFFFPWRVDSSTHWTLLPLASNALGWEPIINRVVDRPLDTKEPHSAQAPGHRSGSRRLMGYQSYWLQATDYVCVDVKSQHLFECATMSG
jgi:hypothetical protein